MKPKDLTPRQRRQLGLHIEPQYLEPYDEVEIKETPVEDWEMRLGNIQLSTEYLENCFEISWQIEQQHDVVGKNKKRLPIKKLYEAIGLFTLRVEISYYDNANPGLIWALLNLITREEVQQS
jgi:hypothetical protein